MSFDEIVIFDLTARVYFAFFVVDSAAVRVLYVHMSCISVFSSCNRT